eukprot:gene2353-4566_t
MYAPDPNTSSYSVANIGCSPGPRKHDAAKQHFQTEGGQVTSFLNNIHPSGRVPYIGKQFPETANKLHESFRTNNSDNFLSSKTNTLASTRVATSKFSPVNIGLNEDERHVPLRAHYKTEAATVQQKLQQVHHSRNLPYMERNYPVTAERLCAIQNEHNSNQLSNTSSSSPIKPIANKRTVGLVNTNSEYGQKLAENIQKEHVINERKMRYNQNVGSQASVYQSLTGRTPMPKDFLYPQNASHQQILTLTGSVMMPSPFKDPPQVSRPKKWLGNDVGWEER